ncbi:DUF3828 domain-containing protein [Brevundimonas sp. VNH65]|uniref:DUF3828 domain-containing protein n=1 Tax=Brevundimonas sp. VNH65 TaxID=3400917 RepID=UPI003C01F115
MKMIARMALNLSLGLVLTSGAASPAAAQSVEASAEAFVREIYAGYAAAEAEDAAPPEDRPPMWSRRMAALIDRDIELAKDDLPFLDADPICNCQDWEGIAVRSVRTRAMGRGRVEAVVRFVNGGEAQTGRFVLIREDGGWRIDDVLNPPYRGLAARLTESNRRVEAGRPALWRD